MASKDKSKEDVQQAPVSVATNLSAQVASLALAYRATNDVVYLERSQVLFKHAMPNIAEHLAKNENLITLMYADGKLDPNDCTDALTEIKDMWPWVYDAIGDTTVLCHIIKSYRTHRVKIPRNRLPFYMVSCCDILQKTSDFSPENYEMIGKSTLEETARRTGPISEPMIDHSDTATAVTICNSAARGFEVLVENSERHLIALQEAQSSTGVVVGSMVEAWNRFGSAVDNDSAKLLATAIHSLALQQLAGLNESGIALARKHATLYREFAVKASALLEESEESEDKSEDEDEDEGEEPE